NSRLRASVLAGVVLVVGVVCAIALRERPVDDPPPSHGMPTNEAKPDAPLEAVGTSPTPAKDAVEQPRVHVAVGASDPPVAPIPQLRGHFVIRVVDGRGEPVVRACVSIGSATMMQTVVTAADGRSRFDLRRVEGSATFRCEVSVPGLSVSRLLTKREVEDVCEVSVATSSASNAFTKRSVEGGIEVVLDPIGYYEFTLLGPPGDAWVHVSELRPGPRRSEGGSIKVSAERVRVPVGLGSRFRLVGSKDSDRRVVEPSTGPTIAGQIVPIEFDFRRCTARWRVAEQLAGPVALLCVTETECIRCTVVKESAIDAFAEVPYFDRAWLVLAAGDRVWESEPLRLFSDVQLGLIALTPRPLLGVLEVLASDGSMSRDSQCVESFVFPSGARLPQRLSTSTLVSTRFNGTGTEFRGLRLLDAVEVRPTTAGCYAEPRLVALRGGTTERVQMSKGAQVELVGDGSRSWWLESVATGERFAATPAVLNGGAVRAHRFESLPPGDYRIVSDTVVFSPDRVTVPAGSQQRVRVALQPK
ncbi:MAG: hypothetical protein ABL997_00970, partial [Planctomycetota bacterium]